MACDTDTRPSRVATSKIATFSMAERERGWLSVRLDKGYGLLVQEEADQFLVYKWQSCAVYLYENWYMHGRGKSCLMHGKFRGIFVDLDKRGKVC